MQPADFLSAVFFYLKVGENLNQNWIVENLNNAFSTWNGKLGELWGLVTTGPQTFKGGAVWSVMQTLHNGMVGIGYALVVLFFAISLCKNTMNFHELKRPEAAIHYFLRFVAAKALVGYGMDIMLNVFSICNGIVTDMADSMGGISEAMVSLPAEMQTAIESCPQSAINKPRLKQSAVAFIISQPKSKPYSPKLCGTPRNRCWRCLVRAAWCCCWRWS